LEGPRAATEWVKGESVERGGVEMIPRKGPAHPM